MPRDKDLKRRIRARMEKTGESYTAARAHILRRHFPSLPDDYEALAGKSDALLAEKTGRTWPEWVAALDDLGATALDHGAIARWVHEQTGLGWWSQTVTVGYERIRGLRDVGQRRGGTYEAGKSRTFPVPIDRLYDAFADDARRRTWLGDGLTLRKATPHKSVRITWSDGTRVVAHLTEKGAVKSTVTVQHEMLPSRAAADEAKAFWKERLDALADLLAQVPGHAAHRRP
jgi:uncharacterized protein YndB with AHSA1/START domain